MGLVFDLNYSGTYMAWASKASSSDTAYITRLMYVNSTFTKDNYYYFTGLHIMSNIDAHGYTAFRLRMDPYTYDEGGVVNTQTNTWGPTGYLPVVCKDSNGNYYTTTLGLYHGLIYSW